MKRDFETTHLHEARQETAPDGSTVRVLCRIEGGSMGHFTLPPGAVSRAVKHRSIDEIWYFLRGDGQMWRDNGARAETVDVSPGTCLTIPAGTAFQFRSSGDEPLVALGQTMPPWPGEDEAVTDVDGPWRATVGAAAG